MLSVQMIAAYLIVPIISVGGFLCHRAGSKALAGMLPLIGAGFLAGALGASLI
ncbi:putative membrane protein (plasmid) [Pseudomonas paraeruginosa]|nr:putative membrane protein [Pseudomonas paraeruginosa]